MRSHAIPRLPSYLPPLAVVHLHFLLVKLTSAARRFRRLQISYIDAKRCSALCCALAVSASFICSPAAQAKKMSKQTYRYSVVDVQSLNAGSPESSIRMGSISTPDEVVECDLLIAGGGVGGVAAALSATDDSMGKRSKIKVCLTEETDWLGGQMTSQGVSALDENYLVETSGACRSYQQFRTNIRDYYRSHFKLTEQANADDALNPGSCWVTWLAFEPKVAVEKLTELLEPRISSGHLHLFMRHKLIYVKLHSGETLCAGSDNAPVSSADRTVSAVGMLDLQSGKITEFRPKVCIDATELGDLLPLAALNYSSGSDSREHTGEPHAPLAGNPDNVQDFTYPFVVDFRPGENHKIEKPAEYDQFNARGKFSFQGYRMFEEAQEGSRTLLPFWEYRRLLAKTNFEDPAVPFDVAMINWDSNDLRGYNIIDQPAQTQAHRLALGKLVSLGFLYWLQNEVTRDDEGKGYPELLLRTDVLGTPDGLSKYPYIRESRRVQARKQIVEKDIVAATNPGARATAFADTVGIGFYPVDIHGMQEIPGAGQATKPFQIPLGALIPAQRTNVYPACKNIGTTHITNGAYRLHPVEWAIGEAQGRFCRMLLQHDMRHEHFIDDGKHLRRLQEALILGGSPLIWFDDVPTDHPQFAAIQFLTVEAILPLNDDSLNFNPQDAISRGDAAAALCRLHGIETASGNDEVQYCMQHKWLSQSNASSDSSLTADDIKSLQHSLGLKPSGNAVETLTRAQFAELLFSARTAKSH